MSLATAPKRVFVFTAAVSAALVLSCSTSSSDVNGFPSCYASAYCHFIYQCCTPADRLKFPSGFSTLQTTLGIDSEGDCASKLSESLQAQAQAVQASVKAKRITWSSQAAQSCLNALNKAASPCSAEAFNAALNGNPSTPATPAVCDPAQLETGTVAAGGTCTLAQDCAGTGSKCSIPTMDGGTPVVQSTGTCVPLPGAGTACMGGQCATGACCQVSSDTCRATQATGAACTPGLGGNTCTAQPCDETLDYCHYAASGSTCQAKLANGTACAIDQFGVPYADSCQSGVCQAGTCVAAISPQYDVCTGNTTGF